VTVAERLEAALAEAAAALEAGDPLAAAPAAERAARICEEARASGSSPSAAERDALLRTQARADAAARAVRARLADEMGRASTARRASLAYGP
jgi:hypothetical protein